MRVEESEFGDFMAASWARLFRTAYLLTGNRQDAEDLLQTVLARTCLRWPSIRDKGAAEAYVRRGLVREVQGVWRRRGREVVTDDVPDAGHAGGLSTRADHLALWQEIRRLPPRMRATLVLRYFEDLTEAQTAQTLGCSVGAVKSQTHHAVARLRVALPDLELVTQGES
jgi:RNA polymerase sigma-70 factor (sigma-E family)